MKSKIIHGFIISLILMVGHLTSVTAVTDAELEALENQIKKLEKDEKNQAEATEKKKAEAEAKRKAEIKSKAEAEAKGKAEEARLSELGQQRQEEEAKKRAEEEKKEKYNELIAEAGHAVSNKDKELAMKKYNEALVLFPGNIIVIRGLKNDEDLMKKCCYELIGTWRESRGEIITF